LDFRPKVGIGGSWGRGWIIWQLIGCIEKFARTEKLVVTCFSEHKKQIAHLKNVIYKLFLKKPLLRKRKDSRAVEVYFYQKHIAKRLKFPTGMKLKHKLAIPGWVFDDKSYLLKCLKGLFETDGDFTIDSHNYTYVLKFSNQSQSLLDDVHKALVGLGYHPQRRRIDVRLARKKEAFGFAKRIRFRQY